MSVPVISRTMTVMNSEFQKVCSIPTETMTVQKPVVSGDYVVQSNQNRIMVYRITGELVFQIKKRAYVTIYGEFLVVFENTDSPMISVYDIRTQEILRRIRPEISGRYIKSPMVQFSKTIELLAIGAGSEFVVVSLDDGAIVSRFNNIVGIVWNLLFSINGDVVFSSFSQGDIVRFDVSTEAIVRVSGYICVTMDVSANTLLVHERHYDYGRVFILDNVTLECMTTIDLDFYSERPLFDSRGEHLIVPNESKLLIMTVDGQIVSEHETNAHVHDLVVERLSIMILM
jgi:hypothetical protein